MVRISDLQRLFFRATFVSSVLGQTIYVENMRAGLEKIRVAMELDYGLTKAEIARLLMSNLSEDPPLGQKAEAAYLTLIQTLKSI